MYGNVGVSYIYSLINQNFDSLEIVLIDINIEKLEGTILDLNHCTSNLQFDTKIRIGNYVDCKDAAIVCITAGPSQSDIKNSRMDDLYKANDIFHSIIPNVAKTGFDGIYLIASNPLDVMSYVTWKYSNCNPYKVIGSGTLLDTARLKFVLSQKMNIPISKINGYVLGEHGNSQFVQWSSINFDNFSIDQKLQIENEVKNAGFYVAKLQGFTCYGIGNCLTRITKAILHDEKCILPVCSYDNESGIYISTPSKIGKNGIEENRIMSLSDDELVRFNDSIRVIHTAIGRL